MSDQDRYLELGRLVAGLARPDGRLVRCAAAERISRCRQSGRRGRAGDAGGRSGPRMPVVITGASLGLAGTERVFDDANIARILGGQQFIGPIPQPIREAMADKHITRLVKSEDGDHRFDVIDSPDDVIKLAARAGAFDVVEEFGVDAERDKALDDYTRLAIGAGFDALRDAGVPLVMHYKTTTVGTKLPERWGLPDSMRTTPA